MVTVRQADVELPQAARRDPLWRVGHRVLWRAHDHGDAVHLYVSRASADVDVDVPAGG